MKGHRPAIAQTSARPFKLELEMPNEALCRVGRWRQSPFEGLSRPSGQLLVGSSRRKSIWQLMMLVRQSIRSLLMQLHPLLLASGDNEEAINLIDEGEEDREDEPRKDQHNRSLSESISVQLRLT